MNSGDAEKRDKNRNNRVTYSGPLSGHTGTLPYDVLETGEVVTREKIRLSSLEDMDNFDEACRVCQ